MAGPPRRSIVVVAVVLFALVAGLSPASAGQIEDKRAEAAAIASKLEDQAREIVSLDKEHRRAQAELLSADTAVARAEADLAAAGRRQDEARRLLAAHAQAAYVGGGTVTFLAQMARSNVLDAGARRTYLRIVAGEDLQAIGRLQEAREDLEVRQRGLTQARRAAAVLQEATASDLAGLQKAMGSQQALLARANGELLTLVAAEQARREAEELRSRPAPAAVAAEAPRVTEPPRVPTSAAPQAQAATTVPAQTQTAAPPASGKGAIAVAEARKQLGKPYVYGGSGPDNFDCSGLTAWAWKAAGVRLSHSAYTQYFETTRVPIDAVQPGDLLFFGKDGVESIHHNAIYIGGGDMIEASQTGTPIRIRGWRSIDIVGAGRPG